MTSAKDEHQTPAQDPKLDKSIYALTPTEREAIKEFARNFGCEIDDRPETWRQSWDTFGPLTIGILKDPLAAGRFTNKMRTVRSALAQTVVDVLQIDIVEYEALDFLAKTKDRFERTNNPYWAWFTFAVYMRSTLPAPSWVWEYLARGAFNVFNAASRRRSLDEKADVEEFSESAFIRALDLNRGTRDCVDKFRLEVEEFRVALQVRNSIDPDNSSRKSRLEAYEAVAGRRRTKGQPLSAEGHRVFRAFTKWFPHFRDALSDEDSQGAF